MSAWSLGYRVGDQVTGLADDKNGLAGYVNKVVDWIPADVVALYAAAVTFLEDKHENPHKGWLVIFLIATPLFVWLGTLAAKKKFTWKILVTGLLAVPAFAIWSMSIPGSGWYSIHSVANNPANVAIGSALGGALFGLIASAIGDRIPSTPIF